MNLEPLQKKLLAAAKANPPADHVPLAFEKRVLAHLVVKSPVDLTILWSRALWRATVPCLAFMLVLTGLALLPTGSNNATATTVTTAASDDLPTVFEQTLLASADQPASFDFQEDN